MNYDGFIEDVSEGDILLVDGGINSLKILSKEGKDVHTEVLDGGTLKSRCNTVCHGCSWWPCPAHVCSSLSSNNKQHAWHCARRHAQQDWQCMSLTCQLWRARFADTWRAVQAAPQCAWQVCQPACHHRQGLG